MLCGALVIDRLTGLIGDRGFGLAKLLCGLLAVAAVAVSPWLGAKALPAFAGLAGVASLALSLALHAGAASSSPDGTDSHDGFGFTEPAALLWLLLVVALRGRRRWAAWAVLALYPAIVLRPMASDVGEISIITALFFAVGTTAVLGAGVARRLVLVDRRRRAATIRLEQRTEFARDLHDFVAHHVTGIVVQAQGALAIAERRPQLVLPALERIEQAGAEALTSMRHMVGMLRDADGEPALAPLAGIAELRTLVEEFSTVGSTQARLDLEGTFDGLPVEVATTAHRVVMEALTNVRKHAHGCAEVQVHVVRSGDSLTVRVGDDGRPHPASTGGFGLKGLAERVGLIGGRIQSGPVTGGGWGVEATLPVTPARAMTEAAR